MFARLFPRLAAKWATWKAGVNLEHEERMEASREARERKPDVEVARVVSPAGDCDALVLFNETRRVLISIAPHGGAIREAKTVAILQHCLDMDGVRVTWVGDQRLRIENRCNEFSVVAPVEMVSRDDRSMTILIR